MSDGQWPHDCEGPVPSLEDGGTGFLASNYVPVSCHDCGERFEALVDKLG